MFGWGVGGGWGDRGKGGGGGGGGGQEKSLMKRGSLDIIGTIYQIPSAPPSPSPR